MDITKYLKEIDQIETEYERNKGSLRAVLDYNPELDLEAGIKEDEEEETNTVHCTKEDMKVVPFMILLMAGILLLVGYTFYWMFGGLWEDDL